MKYYDATKLGEKVAAAAQARLASYAGIAYPAIFLKEVDGEWVPVGDEDFYSVFKARSGGYVIVICDSDGYAKAISSELSSSMAERCVAKMRIDGLSEFRGKLVLPI